MDFFLLSKADPGPVHQARARRLRNVSGGFFVVNFESVTRRYFNNSQHAMFTMLLFSVLILNSKQDPKNSTAPPPPLFEISRSATAYCILEMMFT